MQGLDGRLIADKSAKSAPKIRPGLYIQDSRFVRDLRFGSFRGSRVQGLEGELIVDRSAKLGQASTYKIRDSVVLGGGGCGDLKAS